MWGVWPNFDNVHALCPENNQFLNSPWKSKQALTGEEGNTVMSLESIKNSRQQADRPCL